MLNQDQITETWDKIKGFITTREAEISHEEQWGTRRLAYPIRKGQHRFLEGSYHLTRFATQRAFNRDLENFLKVDEEILELKEAIIKKDGIDEELGDVLFSLVNLSRHLDIDPESSLKKSTIKFIKRFKEIEKEVDIEKLTLDELDEIWNRNKQKNNLKR